MLSDPPWAGRLSLQPAQSMRALVTDTRQTRSRLRRQLVSQAVGAHASGVVVFLSSVLSWNSLCLRNAAIPALSG